MRRATQRHAGHAVSRLVPTAEMTLGPFFPREIAQALRELAREERPERHLRGGNEAAHGMPGVALRPRTTSWYS